MSVPEGLPSFKGISEARWNAQSLDVFNRINEDIKAVFQSAIQGSRGAAEDLLAIAVNTAYCLNQLDQPTVNPAAAPLGERMIMVHQLKTCAQKWAFFEDTEKSGLIDNLRFYIEIGISQLRIEDVGFDNHSMEVRSEKIAEYLLPHIQLTAEGREFLKKSAESIVRKNEGRKIARLKSKEKKERAVGTTCGETRAESLRGKVQKMRTQILRDPSESEIREALKSAIISRLETMSQKMVGLK